MQNHKQNYNWAVGGGGYGYVGGANSSTTTSLATQGVTEDYRSGMVTRGKQKGVKYIIKVL